MIESPDRMLVVPAGRAVIGTSDGDIAALAAASSEARAWAGKGRFSREQPRHELDISTFLIARFPVTVGAFRAFVDSDGYADAAHWTPHGWAWRTSVGRTHPDHWDEARWTNDDHLPVVGVSWYEAIAYCRWLGARTARPIRLPTEVEWEWAARGSDGRRYPWGDAFEPWRCNTRARDPARTLPVGADSPAGDGPFGCAEMVGNVSEWTASAFRPYPYDPDDGRESREGDDPRVTRGGSWFSPDLRARAASRGMNDPWFADHDLGFRIAETRQLPSGLNIRRPNRPILHGVY